MASGVRLSNEQVVQMMRLARSRPDVAWTQDADFAQVRNAHLTNTSKQMQVALSKGYNMMEGDVRLDSRGYPVMAHSRRDDGLFLDQWLDLVGMSGRLIKLDLKDSDAALAAVELISRKGIDPSRIVLNVNSVNWPGMDRMQADQIQWMHEQLPQARIALAIGRVPYTRGVLDQAIEAAQSVDDPAQVTFPLQAQHINPEVVRLLSPYGSISAWNAPDFYDPPSIEAEEKRLRAMGVDGMIDIRHNGDENGHELAAPGPTQVPEPAPSISHVDAPQARPIDWVIGDVVADDIELS